MPKPTVVVVDDDPTIINLMCDILEDEGYQAVIWQEQRLTTDTLGQVRPSLIILDLQ